jgi:hypothetical protein
VEVYGQEKPRGAEGMNQSSSGFEKKLIYFMHFFFNFFKQW